MPPRTSGPPKGLLKQLPHWGPTNIRRQRANFSPHGHLGPSICAPLLNDNFLNEQQAYKLSEVFVSRCSTGKQASSPIISGACIHPSVAKQVLSPLTALNISSGSFRVITKDYPITKKPLTQVPLVSLIVLFCINCVVLCTVCV